MNRRKWRILLWSVCGLAAAFFGFLYFCQDSGGEQKRHIIFISKVIDEENDFWKLLIDGVKMAAAENKIELSVVGMGNEDNYEGQHELIQWAIGQKPDAILLCPSRYTETAPYAKKVVEQGIPLVLVDSDLNEEIADAMVATDNVRLGEVEGSFMKQFVKEDSCIVIVGHVKDSSTAMERELGVRKGLAEHEDKIADVVFCNSDYDKAYDLMMELLGKYPKIDLVAGLNEYSAVGAARAIKDMQLQDQIRVVGIDSSLEEIQMLEEGIFEGIVIQNPFKMGYLGVEEAVKIWNKEKPSGKVDSGCELITKDSVYTEENQKLLFPFREE